MDKWEQDDAHTKLAVVQIELAGVKSELAPLRQEVNLLKSQQSASAGFWAGTKGTVVLILLVLGGVVGAVGLGLNLAGAG